MLKGKKGLYILFPVVAFIWGAIIYQVVDAFSEDDPVIADPTTITMATIKTKERAPFSIHTISRDPFLGKAYKIARRKEVKKPSVVSQKPPIIWPSIRYKGRVSNQNTADAVFLLEINGTEYLIKKNQSEAAVTVLKGTATYIRLRYQGKTKQFNLL
ncbi:hypothetical protein ACFSTE_14820 [Aquimarina hainanensis]|uniref:Uncharacterized protein n=1 Tax=Aquimarina hainanensis TaxID=1578017 RepID=A0ABW5NB49_9FLAO|nr:hypothetical protein [Aquimarina sp. TRL1]QKX03553.1 hypothetical protein HN014_01030 [Aquimarina sp. TRL1]